MSWRIINGNLMRLNVWYCSARINHMRKMEIREKKKKKDSGFYCSMIIWKEFGNHHCLWNYIETLKDNSGFQWEKWVYDDFLIRFDEGRGGLYRCTEIFVWMKFSLRQFCVWCLKPFFLNANLRKDPRWKAYHTRSRSNRSYWRCQSKDSRQRRNST